MLRVARLAALLGATLALWACECPGPGEEIFLLRDPDPETQQLVDRCLDPTLMDCMPLCQKLVGQSPATIVHCEIHPQTDPAFVQVHVGIQGICFGG
jgi:hypothetical protein